MVRVSTIANYFADSKDQANDCYYCYFCKLNHWSGLIFVATQCQRFGCDDDDDDDGDVEMNNFDCFDSIDSMMFKIDDFYSFSYSKVVLLVYCYYWMSDQCFS